MLCQKKRITHNALRGTKTWVLDLKMKDLKDLRIGVFRGGLSPEREISLISGQNVIEALISRGYNVLDVDLRTKNSQDIIKIIRGNSIDLVFIALHGEFGEDGGIQRILERHRVPFTGSDSGSSRICMDKIQTLRALEKNDIPHPEYWLEDKGLPDFSPYDFPLIVKPHYAGSSIGISIVRHKQELEKATEEAKRYSHRALVERFVEGRELTVGILGETILPIIEVVFARDLFDFFCKYEDNVTRFIVPAKLPKESYADIQKLAYRVYRVLGCRHLGRVDLRIDKDYRPYVLELNSIPGLTPHSLLPLAAKNAGIDFQDLCEEIVKEAVEDYKSVPAK